MIGSATLAAVVFDLPLLVPLALGVPLLLLLACAFPRLRRRLPALFALAPLPALAAALLAGAEPDLVLGNAAFALTFALDAPGAMLLGVASVLWILARGIKQKRTPVRRPGFFHLRARGGI